MTSEKTGQIDTRLRTLFEEYTGGAIDRRDFKYLIEFQKMGKAAKLAVPTTDHYIPMIYALALAGKKEPIVHTFEEVIGSISMRCFRVG